MKAQGQITIEEGLILNNPTMEFGDNTSYSKSRNTVEVECIFSTEDSTFKYSRQFKFDTGGNQMTRPDVLSMISEHNILKMFK